MLHSAAVTQVAQDRVRKEERQRRMHLLGRREYHPRAMPISRQGRTAVLLCVALVAACRGEDDEQVQRVLLITCDTLRADHLGCYGYERDVSPELDAFARSALRFDEAYSTAPLTVPAVSALLTGRMPEEIGATAGNQALLPPDATTLAEVLRGHGLATAAVVSNWVLRRHAGRETPGVAQGFDAFDDEMTTPERVRAEVLERIASETTDAAIAWLDDRPGDRFFLWVHYQDPHGPYTPPESYVAAQDRPLSDEPELQVGRRNSGKGEIPGYQALGDLRHPDHYRIRYDAEIAYFDLELGRLLDHLEAQGLLGQALIIFTADHGESLGERGYWFSHGQHLHRELVRVPLLVRHPHALAHSDASSDAAGYRRVTRAVSHLDLWPTVLAALGLPSRPSRGRDLLAGTLDPERIVAQSGAGWLGLTAGSERLLVRDGTPMLFDLSASSDESQDLASVRPDRVRALLERYQAQLAQIPSFELQGVRPALDAQGTEALRELGYAANE